MIPRYPGICPMAMIDGLKKLSMVTVTLESTSWSMVIMEILAMENLDQRPGEQSHRLIII